VVTFEFVFLGDVPFCCFFSALRAHANLTLSTCNFNNAPVAGEWTEFVLGSAVLLIFTIVSLGGAEIFAKISSKLFALAVLSVGFALAGFFTPAAHGPLDDQLGGLKCYNDTLSHLHSNPLPSPHHHHHPLADVVVVSTDADAAATNKGGIGTESDAISLSMEALSMGGKHDVKKHVSKHDAAKYVGFTGFSLDTLKDNLWADYVTDDETGDDTNYLFVFAVFYPCVTGIMAGASMSGDLKDPGKSIPRGSLAALFTALFVYVGIVTFAAATVKRCTLQHNYVGSASALVTFICVSLYSAHANLT
jgi:amino acid transporter